MFPSPFSPHFPLLLSMFPFSFSPHYFPLLASFSEKLSLILSFLYLPPKFPLSSFSLFRLSFSSMFPLLLLPKSFTLSYPFTLLSLLLSFPLFFPFLSSPHFPLHVFSSVSLSFFSRSSLSSFFRNPLASLILNSFISPFLNFPVLSFPSPLFSSLSSLLFRLSFSSTSSLLSIFPSSFLPHSSPSPSRNRLLSLILHSFISPPKFPLFFLFSSSLSFSPCFPLLLLPEILYPLLSFILLSLLLSFPCSSFSLLLSTFPSSSLQFPSSFSKRLLSLILHSFISPPKFPCSSFSLLSTFPSPSLHVSLSFSPHFPLLLSMFPSLILHSFISPLKFPLFFLFSSSSPSLMFPSPPSSRNPLMAAPRQALPLDWIFSPSKDPEEFQDWKAPSKACLAGTSVSFAPNGSLSRWTERATKATGKRNATSSFFFLGVRRR
ncbi:hypothetical protein C7M84_003324 [Penaeus vannamei]|uniref:Uncharacterized protein n=1 Tax=Penaeus vannamei TaxID=6689 RepID=A0A423TNH1_PENVA|nr:hypothetical protein C7M84_003324 [Penaeus vannamei]